MVAARSLEYDYRILSTILIIMNVSYLGSEGVKFNAGHKSSNTNLF